MAALQIMEAPLKTRELLDLLRLANEASDYEVRLMAKHLAREAIMPSPLRQLKSENS